MDILQLQTYRLSTVKHGFLQLFRIFLIVYLALKEWEKGSEVKAIFHFSSMLEDYKRILNSLRPSAVELSKPLFKIRPSDDPLNEPQDLFHIPFESRSIIKPYRYSISNSPCLYLGGSSYVCWEECVRPKTKRINLSAFKVNKKLSVLNFGFRPAFIAAGLQNETDSSFKHWLQSFGPAEILIFTLLLGCSVKVFDSKLINRPEYILPQLLLQWVQKNDSGFDGIRFFSTKVNQYHRDSFITANFAFPAKELSRVQGYCQHLCGLLSVTKPVHVINLLKSPNKFNHCISSSRFLTGKRKIYDYTIFSNVDNIVSRMQYYNIT